MSKKTELLVMESIARGILADGAVEVRRTGLIFHRIDEDVLRHVGAYLQAVDASSAWWWGDYLAANCGYKIKVEEKEHGPMDEITKGDRLKQYTATYAAIAGKEPKTLWTYTWIARFYNSSSRLEELTWSHHLEATNGADGDLAKAQEWLDAARENRWSASELRAAIRKTRRKEDDEGPAAQTLLPIELVACRRFASTHLARVADMDVEEARAQLAELEQVHAYIMALTRRVAPTLSSLPTPPGGKESLSASA